MNSSTPGPVEVWLDIESAGLRPSDRPWEVAMIRRTPDGRETLHVWQIADFEPGKADPKALALGGFYERHRRHVILNPDDPLDATVTDEHQLSHPAYQVSGPDPDQIVDSRMLPEMYVAYELERLVRGAVIWCCNPTYDVPRLEAMHERHGRAWTAHYRPLDATTYAAATALTLGYDVGPYPWRNEQVGAAIGVDRDDYGTAHTGLADCFYAKALVDRARSLAAAPTSASA